MGWRFMWIAQSTKRRRVDEKRKRGIDYRLTSPKFLHEMNRYLGISDAISDACIRPMKHAASELKRSTSTKTVIEHSARCHPLAFRERHSKGIPHDYYCASLRRAKQSSPPPTHGRTATIFWRILPTSRRYRKSPDRHGFTGRR